MSSGLVYAVGFVAQALFSARLLVQWIKSEKAGKSLSPTLFWKLSIIASWMLFVYGMLRNDFAIVLGQVIAYSIYIRNLQIKGEWQMLSRSFRLICTGIPILAFGYMAMDIEAHFMTLFSRSEMSRALLLWGSAGQVIFTLRFVYQWIFSEKRGQSLLPLGFWIISLIGSAMILSYAVYRKDPVLFLGQGFGALIYSRNLVLIMRSRKVS